MGERGKGEEDIFVLGHGLANLVHDTLGTDTMPPILVLTTPSTFRLLYLSLEGVGWGTHGGADSAAWLCSSISFFYQCAAVIKMDSRGGFVLFSIIFF